MKKEFDVVIIGAGIAGLSQAIRLSELDTSLKIGVLSKNSLQLANTHYAQGGIAAVMSVADSFKNHSTDTMLASQNAANQEVVDFVVENAPRSIHQLEEWGVQFDKENHDYHLGLEGGHSHRRIVHVQDKTGAEIHNRLIEKVMELDNVILLENYEAVQLFMNEERQVAAVLVYNHENDFTTIIKSHIVVIATGGLGQLFEHTTNPENATGDGIALAREIGARVDNLKAVQFHPTALMQADKKQLSLISEAVRGAGAQVVNHKGERFLFKTDERGELATRDIVSNAIYEEIKKWNNESIYLDFTPIPFDRLKMEFPTIFEMCKAAGYDISKEKVPVIPAAHYSCGGIKVNMEGQTSVPFLYAIGECANTGLHGNNRLASNSLLEAIAYTNRVADNIIEMLQIEKIPFGELELTNQIKNKYPKQFEFEIERLKKFMTSYYITKDPEEIKMMKIFLKRYQKRILDLPFNELSVIHFRWRINIIIRILNEFEAEKETTK